MAYTAEQIANFFIYLTKDDPDSDMTNMRLNKLLYLSQVYYMHSHSTPLFSDNIEAWEHGPVVYDVYKKYKDCGSNKIKNVDTGYNEEEIDEETADFLLGLLIDTNKYSTSYLRDISHYYGGSWQRHYRGENRTPLPKGAIENDFDYVSSRISHFDMDEVLKKIPRYKTYRDEDGTLVVVR